MATILVVKIIQKFACSGSGASVAPLGLGFWGSYQQPMQTLLISGIWRNDWCVVLLVRTVSCPQLRLVFHRTGIWTENHLVSSWPLSPQTRQFRLKLPAVWSQSVRWGEGSVGFQGCKTFANSKWWVQREPPLSFQRGRWKKNPETCG